MGNTFEWNEVIQQLYGKDNEEMSLESQTKQTKGHFEVMFTWKDYEKNSRCFIGNSKVSVAGIIYKNNIVEDSTTGKRFKLKSETLDEQKKEAEKILLKYWNDVIKEFSKYISGKTKLNEGVILVDEKMKEIRNLMKQAEVVMYHYLDNSSSDDCIFNKSDLWEQRHKTLCEVMEILER